MEQKSVGHTPGPWLFTNPLSNGRRFIRQAPESGGAKEICVVNHWSNGAGEENAAFIVRACNTHEQLLAAAAEALSWRLLDKQMPEAALDELRAAIAKARGEG